MPRMPRITPVQVVLAVALVVHDMAEQFVSAKEGISRVVSVYSCARPSLALVDLYMVDQFVFERKSVNRIVFVPRGANPSRLIVYF
jgi:hypothetical protein